MEQAMPLDDDSKARFDQQDEVLREQNDVLRQIRDDLVAHREYHRLTDPGVAEMVDVLKGAKAVKKILAFIVGIVATCAAAWAWMVDHVKVIK